MVQVRADVSCEQCSNRRGDAFSLGNWKGEDAVNDSWKCQGCYVWHFKLDTPVTHLSEIGRCCWIENRICGRN